MRSVRDGVLDHGQSVMSRRQSGAGLVRRVVSRRYEEYLVEGQSLLRVCGHRQVAAMNGVKGTAQYPDASVWGMFHRVTTEALRHACVLEQQRKVVPVDHFFVFLHAHFAFNVLRSPPLDGRHDCR